MRSGPIGLRPASRGRIAAARIAVAVALAAAAAATLLLPGDGITQQGGAATALPLLGVADVETVLMGAAPEGERGEAWAYRVLPPDTPPPSVGGRRVEFGPQTQGAATAQLAFLRHTDATGWQIADTPTDADGETDRGPAPNPLSAATTSRGGGLLVGRDSRREAGEQSVLLLRDRGDRFRERTLPPGTLEAGEDVGTDQGLGRVAADPYDTATAERTGLFVAAVGPRVEDAILHFDGLVWRREEVVLPPGVTEARITAVDATGTDDAFALVESDADPFRGVELYRRGSGAGPQLWERVELGEAVFDDRDTPAEKIEQVTALRDSADALSVTPDGLWIDGSLRSTTPTEPQDFDFTLFVDADRTAGERLRGSWCDAPKADGTALCDRPLGVGFSQGVGYRSFAFGGPGFGTRVVTNPVEPGQGDDSNRGTYARFAGERFERRAGGGGSRRRSGAFGSIDEGWLQGPVQVTSGAPPVRLKRWPVALRSPLVDATTAPGTRPGGLDAQALAVGADGAVTRFVPRQGWVREFLLSSAGAVSRPRLRGVAWPEPGRAHAVGDTGAMWQWRADTGLWERDPAAPIGFEGQLMDVAFHPGQPERGYAVGRAGVLLRYDKTWTQDALPAEAAGRDLTSIAFAGNEALVVAGGDLLVNDGSGWRVDQGVRDLLAALPGGAYLRAVAGLPDGGAVVAGRNVVLKRGGAGQPWRFTEQPLLDQTVVAAAAIRADGDVRAVVSVQPRLPYPQLGDVPAVDPNVPPPILPPQPLPGDGYVLRETTSGWRDDQRTAFSASSVDRPIKSDPVAALLLDDQGSGWAIGGWSGEPDFAGRGTPQADDRVRVQTAAIQRYAADGDPPAPPTLAPAPVDQPPGIVRLAVGGHAQCETPCADLANQAIAPDRMLSGALGQASDLAGRPGGPRAFLYTGGRTKPAGAQPQPAREAERYAELLGAPIPAFAAVSDGDSAGGSAASFTRAMAARPAPLGQGPAPAGIAAGSIPGIGASAGARTHYAFDIGSPEGTVRVAVIDNSRGSLALSDPHQNPAEPQLPWLRSVLQDARNRGIASVVMGSRDLSRFRPRLNAASDGDEVSRVLVEEGASAYFFERPEENRVVRIPSGGERTIPAFGTGTLGYRSPLRDAAGADLPVSLFGDGVFLLAEVDVAKRDATTNVAPVGARAIPVVEDLSLQATDGTLLRRSRPALFQGLGRRPVEGDRWGEASGDAGPSPPGGDPYTVLPSEPCLIAGCDTRLSPEYRFTSSDPDIGDFVRQDPQSTNLRKPLIDAATDKVVTDNASGLFCPFNPGETTVTIRSGGLSFSQTVTVLAGSVQRPCGTRPLAPERFEMRTAAPPAVQAPELPTAAPTSPPTPEIQVPPPPPPAAPEPEPRAERPPRPPAPAPPPPPEPFVPLVPLSAVGPPPAPPPPPIGGFVNTIPPGGVSVRVLEEKREEEAAPEQSQAFSRYSAEEGPPVGPLVVGAVVLLAVSGAAIGPSLRRRDRHTRTALAAVRTEPPTRRRHL